MSAKQQFLNGSSHPHCKHIVMFRFHPDPVGQTVRRPPRWPIVQWKPPVESAADQPQLANGKKFTAEVLDRWNMTVTPMLGEFTLQRKEDESDADANGRSIPLPGKPYLAVRIKSTAQRLRFYCDFKSQ